jgi:hypothetical protein
MKKVFYISYQTYFVELAKKLKKNDWFPIYCSVNSESAPIYRKSFPDIICHDHYDAIRAIPPAEMSKLDYEPVPDIILDKMYINEANALRILLRNGAISKDFDLESRKAHYKKLLKYWYFALNYLKPDYVIFEEEPHQCTDYVLYTLCGIMNINTILFIRTKFPMTFYPVKKFEEGSLKIRDNLSLAKEKKDYSNIILPESISKYFQDLSQDYDKAMDHHLFTHSNAVKKIANSDISLNNRLKDIYLKIIFLISPNLIFKRLKLLLNLGSIFQSDQKQYNKPFSFSKPTYLEHVINRSKTINTKNKLKKIYDSFTSISYDLNDPYIYCTLQYQPEKTTCPLGNEFDNQLLMVEKISKHLPKGWKLYVKEHPSQFASTYARNGENYRSKNFYEKLNSISNVVLIPLTSNNFEMIDNAMAVASVTSTSCWEAVLRNKPSIVFGHCWFRYCEGVFYIDSDKKLDNFMKNVLPTYRVDNNKVKLFTKILLDHSFPGIIGGQRLRKYYNISDKENAESHYNAIRDLIS